MLSPFECLCGNFILPEPANYVFSYPFFFLRNLLYLIHFPPPRKSPGRWLYAAWLGVSILPLLTQPASATTIWEKATEIMKDVYQQILLISTIAAIVTASVALLMMNFSRSGRTVEESRAWLKRIAITWAILNGLGFIMAYVTPFFSGGQWTA